ncbi:hypothetical protein NX029_04275 [Cytobacillus firmus]|nr:hypothetical protein [Cytobacillus firmus]
MNQVLSQSVEEYKKFVEDYYPRTSFKCSQFRKLIINLFTLVEITDVYLDYLRDTEYNDYLFHIRHQFLLMLYNLPNYNSFFISSLQRSISESLLRMTLVSVGHNIENANSMPFFRIQEKLKNTDDYRCNQNDFKKSCDSLFSYFGANSRVIHNNSLTKQTNIDYIIAFNVSPNDLEVEKLSKFLKVIRDHVLTTFSGKEKINDSTLSLGKKIQLKNILGNELYQSYFSCT